MLAINNTVFSARRRMTDPPNKGFSSSPHEEGIRGIQDSNYPRKHQEVGSEFEGLSANWESCRACEKCRAKKEANVKM